MSEFIAKLYEEWKARFGDVLSGLMLAQVRALDSIRGDSAELPVTDHAMIAHLKQHSPSSGPDGKRWVVRTIALRNGKCSTVGVFQKRDDAEAFLQFWGTWVNTEVKLAEVEKGVDAWSEEPLDWSERMWSRRPPLPKRPTPPRPFRRPGPFGGRI